MKNALDAEIRAVSAAYLQYRKAVLSHMGEEPIEEAITVLLTAAADLGFKHGSLYAGFAWRVPFQATPDAYANIGDILESKLHAKMIDSARRDSLLNSSWSTKREAQDAD